MLVLLIFVKPCRVEKALVVEKRTFKERRDDMRKGKHDVFAYIIPGWGSERKIRFSSNHPRLALVSSSSMVFPLHLASTEGEVRKRGETAPRHQIILLPIALWLRTQSPNCRELYLFYSLSLIRVAILSRLPFEVLFPCMANSSNDLRLIQAWTGGRAEVVSVGM